jgi:CHAD domain-containing protein
MGDAERDQVEGIRGYRRAVKKIRCALQLTAGGLGLEKRKELDAQWASLARRLGVMRDRDARDTKINEIISLLPTHAQEGARLAWVGACGLLGGTMRDAEIQDPPVVHQKIFTGQRNATAARIEPALSSHDHRELLEGLASDTERMILATEAIRFLDLTPQMVAGSVEHLWNRAQRQARKSWDGRDQAWLHALRKRVQRAHIAFRLLRAQSGERGLEVEKRLDVAAKVMGEFRDACMLESQLRDHFAQVGFVQTAPTQTPLQHILSAQEQLSQTPAPTPLSEIITPLEMLRNQVSQSALEATTESHKLVTKAFKLSIKKTLRHIALQIRAL